MRRLSFYRAQSLVDFMLIIVVVGLVFIGLEVYVKRGMQGKVKELTDYIITKDAVIKQLPDTTTGSNLFSSSSTVTSKEFKGGAKSLKGDEVSVYTYSNTTPQTSE